LGACSTFTGHWGPVSSNQRINRVLLMLTYMKLSGIEIGLLVNFNVKMLKDGIKWFKI